MTNVIGGFEFPSLEGGDTEFAKEWKPHIFMYPLDTKVLVAARTRIEGKWKAYCGVVDGYDHDQEVHGVLLNGSPIAEDIARSMFPKLKDVPYSR